MTDARKEPDLVREPLAVIVVKDEIVLETTASPSLTGSAARLTGQRLIDAADRLELDYGPNLSG
jgi:hypothetical protein